MDIEDLKEKAKSETFCPYYYTQMAKDYADILFLPYNYLLSPNRFPQFKLNLEKSVVIFDEAHNVLEVAEEGASFLLETPHLQAAIEELGTLNKTVLNIGLMQDFIQ